MACLDSIYVIAFNFTELKIILKSCARFEEKPIPIGWLDQIDTIKNR